ncbi:ABC transporter substrate-binding protein [Clostridium vincentii]|uniref:NMT1/THI5 like protein n=1 Tax=Clostridium vincentii TaxID=52704 RepID=A0A2T0BHX2_9CLOT|nr:NMT1/THI5 like protein [Clostridium vincentii]
MNKKSKLALLLATTLTFTMSFVGCEKKVDTELKEVRLSEVVRSVFYAPMYAAINQGFFEEEGLSVQISTAQGADKVMQTVLSKNADIGFCGPEQVIYINNQGREDYPILFAQLTQKDGSFLVSKTEQPDFTWESLKGKKIIGGRPGGVPEMALEYVMKNHGINPKQDVEMVTNIDFTATAGAFKAGSSDYVALFEPTASMLEAEGGGSIVASIGESSGKLAYTCFFSSKSYMDENPETIEKFTRAIYKGQQWIQANSSEEIATSIISFFPGTDKDIMIKVIDNYKEIEALAETPSLQEEDLDKLMDVIQSYDSALIPSRPSYDKIVNNSFAEKVISEKK